MGPDPPPPPNYGPIADAQVQQSKVDQAAADRSFQLGEDQLQFQRDAFQKSAAMGDAYFKAYQDQQTQNKQLFGEVWPDVENQMKLQNEAATKAAAYTDTQIDAAKQASTRSGFLWDRFTNTLVPLQDQLLDKIKGFNTPERANMDAAAAEADVRTAQQAALDNSDSELSRYGIDPSQGRRQALDRASMVAGGAATAAAGTLARRQTEDRALALLGEGNNITMGMPAQVGQQLQLTSLGATGFGAFNPTNTGANTGIAGVTAGNNLSPATTLGSMALNPYTSAVAPFGSSGAGIYGAGTNALSGANVALAGAGSTLTEGFNAQMSQYEAERKNSADMLGGIGKIIGGVGGFALGGPFGASIGSSIFGGAGAAMGGGTW